MHPHKFGIQPLPWSIPKKNALHLLFYWNLSGVSSRNISSLRTCILMNISFLVRLVILYCSTENFAWSCVLVIVVTIITTPTTALPYVLLNAGNRRNQDNPLVIIFIILSLSLLEFSYHCYHYSAANHTRVRTIVHKKMLDIVWWEWLGANNTSADCYHGYLYISMFGKYPACHIFCQPFDTPIWLYIIWSHIQKILLWR